MAFMENSNVAAGAVLAGVYDVHKRFPGVLALRGVTLEIRSGEVRCLIGENGAGKSTLVKLLAGVYQPDQGTVVLGSNTASVSSPNQALQRGVSTIYQEFTLVPEMTVAENVFLGREPTMGGAVLHRSARLRRTAAILKEMGIADIDPQDKVRNLGVAYQQMVEIAKALSLQEERVLILDEPTSSLTSNEIDRLFNLLRRLRRRGLGLLYITHRLHELKEIGDVVTVMRDGAIVMDLVPATSDDQLLIESMVGRKVEELYPRRSKTAGEPILEVRHLSARPAVNNASFAVARGEVVGLFGLVGAGRTELVRALFGADKVSGGEVHLRGHRVSFRSPGKAVAAGVGFVPEDRQRQGLVPLLSVAANIALSSLLRLARARFVLSKRSVAQLAERYVRELGVRTPSIHQSIYMLSGGNQQKCILARVLAADPDIIILDEPTRGIDVGARSEIYRLINSLCDEGKGVLMVTSDLPEAIGMSDRILVMRQGRIVADVESAGASQSRIMEHAFGVQSRDLEPELG
jgi:ribose transport system ATP-binding protein